MGSLILKGQTSGEISISPPAVAGASTLLLPAGNDTMATLNATQTLTNKTLTTPSLTSPTITSGSILNSSGNPILKQTGSVIQTQYVSSSTRVSTTHTTFTEPSTAYRVAITPSSTSNMILLRYFIPMQVSSASNVLQLFRAFRSVGGTKNYSLTSAGSTSGSRNVIAGMMNRPWNGYDGNDALNWQVDVVDFPSTTSEVTYGFETKPESTNTTYFGYTASDNATWGFDADIVIIAQEIAQ